MIGPSRRGKTPTNQQKHMWFLHWLWKMWALIQCDWLVWADFTWWGPRLGFGCSFYKWKKNEMYISVYRIHSGSQFQVQWYEKKEIERRRSIPQQAKSCCTTGCALWWFGNIEVGCALCGWATSLAVCWRTNHMMQIFSYV